jgi:probable phosphoglycerate mutase
VSGPERVIVEADGGSRGNPGPAGYGAVVRAAGSGEVLARRRGGLGTTTNNVAEYTGLIEGLATAAELGAMVVAVRMDSKLVVEQSSGRWKVRNEALKPLAARAGELVRGFRRVSFEWIRRERNTLADALANEAMDEQAGQPVPAVEADPAETAVSSSTRGGPGDVQTGPPAGWSGARGQPTRLVLLRHGQTELSVQRRYSGLGDPPLTEVGQRQAKAAAARLARTGALLSAQVSAVVSSPLDRTMATAAEVGSALELPVQTDTDLIEADFGEWEGLTFAEAAERHPDAHRRWITDPSAPIPGGESLDEVYRRVGRARERLTTRHAGSSVVVVSHATPIKSLVRMGLEADAGIVLRLHLDLASFCIVEFYPDGNSSVRLANDTAHLYEPVPG